MKMMALENFIQKCKWSYQCKRSLWSRTPCCIPGIKVLIRGEEGELSVHLRELKQVYSDPVRHHKSWWVCRSASLSKFSAIPVDSKSSLRCASDLHDLKHSRRWPGHRSLLSRQQCILLIWVWFRVCQEGMGNKI